MTRALLWLSLALVAFRVLSAAFVVIQPGFTDAYYYVDVARRLAHGQGLTADFVWNFIEAPQLAPLPVPSHRFWMPLTTVVQAAGRRSQNASHWPFSLRYRARMWHSACAPSSPQRIPAPFSR